MTSPRRRSRGEAVPERRSLSHHVGKALAEESPDAAREQAAAAADFLERVERRAENVRRQLAE